MEHVAMRLDGRTALVTGGGSGIGAATARRLAREGAGVAVMGRRLEPLEGVAAEVGGIAVAGDAADAADAERAVATAVERFGRLDALIANAGGEGGGAVGNADDPTWQAGLRGNLTSCFVCARAALPRLVERSGSIVIVSSSPRWRPGRRWPATRPRRQACSGSCARSRSTTARPECG
jgi:NAD(P)-dependent dehydrogenase (short-subunit alcohol dehydrogenase family)